MAVSALYASSSGMRALDEKLNVVANNLANVNTVGFKRSRVNFEDLLYQVRREPGARNLQDEPGAHGILVGLGTRVSGTQLDFQTGSFDVTNNKLDLAILGDGFFQVRTLQGGTEVIAYTRAGNFTINAEGSLVLGNQLGSILEPPIQLTDIERDSIVINERGQIFGRPVGQAQAVQLGQLELARFVNPEGLLPIGNNLYLATDASGDPITGEPTQDGLGSIAQGTLELSNVDPVRELVDLIFTQRAFELNSEALRKADESLQTVVRLARTF